MGLKPLEFADCLTDSPFFRSKLHDHEKELDRTSKSIKALITDGKELLTAARNLSKAQKAFSTNLKEFQFECIGSQQTDDELVIAASLQEFGRLIEAIEDERDRMLEKAAAQFIEPLEVFRKKQIGGAKDGKKRFDRQTTKFCQSLERHLNLKTKINDNTLQEADAAVEMERRHFYQASMKYVLQLQEVQERKKFEFVEIFLGFMYSLLTFYHQGHEVAKDFKPYMTDLQVRLQKTRESFESTREEAEQLMMKMLEVRGTKPVDNNGSMRLVTRQGYLFVMEKKALGTTWNKHYCQYQKETKEFILIPYSQITGKPAPAEKLTLTSCVRRATESIEKRFCFDITMAERQGPLTLQALSEEDRRAWLDAMDGREPVYTAPTNTVDESLLDDIGFNFIKKCITAVENNGLDEQGLYRVVGVNSKVTKLTNMGLDRRKVDKLCLDDLNTWEIKTITSSVKGYLRSLPEPLMTFKLHDALILAAKQESKTLRIYDIHTLTHKLPEQNFEMLDLLLSHLKRVAELCEKNLMTVANLGVCFGPTLMRPREETMAAIMDIKFCNIVVEILITNFDKIFKTPPVGADISDMRVTPSREHFESMGSHLTSTSSGPKLNSHLQPVINRPTRVQQHTHNLQIAAHQQNQMQNNVSHAVPMYANSSVVQQYQGVGYVSGSAAAGGAVGSHASLAVTGVALGVAGLANNKLRTRPGGIYVPSAVDAPSSTSSSSESLNQSQPSLPSLSQSQASMPSVPSSSPQMDSNRRPQSSFVAMAVNRLYGTPPENTNAISSTSVSMTGSLGSLSSTNSKPGRRTVRTLYACDAENESELSFEPNQIVYNVRVSREPGWLEGSLSGKTGLLPANYVEFID